MKEKKYIEKKEARRRVRVRKGKKSGMRNMSEKGRGEKSRRRGEKQARRK